MAGLSRFLDKQVDIEISGNTTFSGTLLDIGHDIIVIYDGRTFLYIPSAASALDDFDAAGRSESRGVHKNRKSAS